MLKAWGLLFFIGFCGNLIAQPNEISVRVLDVEAGSTPSGYAELVSPETEVRKDEILNEKLVNLVDCWTVDSTYSRKTERHQFFGAAPLRWFGIRWKTVRYTREKFVGTVIKTSISNKERFTEYDVNFNLAPHLPEHRMRSHDAYQAQASMAKARKAVKDGQAPYVLPEEGMSAEPYKVHVEITPKRELRPNLHHSFYPTARGGAFGDHPNVGDLDPAIGVYGPLILDCNHKCHPEIHPYEWIWWMDVNEQESGNQQAGDQTWHVGFMKDASNRFIHWSSNPRTGQISIPFAFDSKGKAFSIEIAHLLFTDFADGLELMELPEDVLDVSKENYRFELNDQNLKGKSLEVHFSYPLPTEGYRWWIDGLVLDRSSGLLTGDLHIALSVEELYLATIRSSTLR